MAENESGQDKTEEPTQHRIDEAVKKGQIAFSKEVSNFFILLVLALNIAWFVNIYGPKFSLSMAHFIHSPHEVQIDQAGMLHMTKNTLVNVGMLIILPIAGTIIVALFSSFMQNGIVISADPLIPKLEKISVFKGIKRMFSLKSLMEFIKGLIKISLVAIVAWLAVAPEIDKFPSLPSMDILDIIGMLQVLGLKLVIGALSVMLIVAILDYSYQKFEYTKSLRMTRQEIKDEYKQVDGDPKIKARLRQIRMERAQKRMMSAVPDADVIVRNPTHYAVALKYDESTMSSPIVVAKGLDLIALKIIEVGGENDVVVVTNKPLARALYDSSEIDEEIPVEHYQAVAAVIGYVYRLRRGERIKYTP